MAFTMQGMEARTPSAVAEWIDRQIGHALDYVVSAVILAEIVILFVGILARYVFHVPLVWSDELASLLFLWLAMLGTALGLRKGEHMAMTAVVNLCPGPWRVRADALARVATLAFLVCIFLPSLTYVEDEALVVMPALGISQTWRTAAMPVGIGLMILSILLRVARGVDRDTLLAAVVAIAVGGALYLISPALPGLRRINLIIFFLALAPLMVLAAIPIAVSFGLATLGYLALSTRIPVSVLVARLDAGMSHLILLAIPLFVFLGLLIEVTGMTRVMVSFLANLIGDLRGGLHYVLVAAMYLVSGISGSKAADMAAVAPVLFPEMEKRGAERGELVALLAATGAQTETVPPSLVLITIGSVTGVSIAALFTGGLLPSLILGLMLCALVWFHKRGTERATERAPARVVGRAFLVALPALVLPVLVLPVLIRACVMEGVATATEVSTIGIVYTCLVGILIYREFDTKRLKPMLVRTAILSGTILFIIGAATAMAWAITQSGFSRDLAQAMSSLPGGQMTFLAVSILMFAVLGSVLEGIPAVVLFGPLLFPVAKQLGIDEVHYSMVVVISMGLGLFAPPFGVGFYVACAMGNCSPDRGMRHIWTYMAVLLAGLAAIAAFPWISIGFL